jgi:hypothetical protein
MPDYAGPVRELLRSVRSSEQLADGRIFGRLVDAGVRAFAWHVRVIRPDDLLVLDFRFLNLRRDGDKLQRTKPGDAYLVVEHQTQSLADGAFANIADQPEYSAAKDMQGHADATPPVRSRRSKRRAPPHAVPIPPQVPIRAAGPSRLVFAMPADEAELQFTLDALLDACRRWPLHLDGGAQPEPIDSRLAVDLGWVADDLAVSMAAAKAMLGGELSPQLLVGLDAVAERLADRTLAAARGRRPLTAGALEAEADREIVLLLGDQRAGTVDETRIAAGLYLRAAAGRRAVDGLRRAGVGVEGIAQLAPGFYGVLLAPHPPSLNETAIEMPWRLIGSPLKTAGFAHEAAPVVHADRTELWHTRLGQRHEHDDGTVTVDDRASQKLRYLWSPDYDVPTSGGPTFSLDGVDRKMIVKLTAGYDESRGRERYIPRPVTAKRLMLTALGGLLDADRRWTVRPDGVDLLAWTHRASQGRDSYVRVEYAGFLYPFGHAATLVKLSERVFEWRGPPAAKDRVAVLRQRFFIVVREPSRSYPNGAPQPFEGRSMPFTSVECLVGTTPDLATPGGNSGDRLADGFYTPDRPRRMAFWPSRGSEGLFLFPMTGIDSTGRRVQFSTPLMFVSEVVNTAGLIDQIRDHYNGVGPAAAPSSRRNMDTLGGTLRFAEPDGPDAADVDLPAVSLLIRSVDPVGGISASQQPELQQQPLVEESVVRLAAVERLTGQSKSPVVVFDPDYLAGGFGGPGTGELFLRMKAPASLDFGSAGAGSDTVGGLATPSMVPAGLSRRHGVASAGPAGLSNFANGTFNPADYFPSAKLLGFFDLKDLLSVVPLGPASPVLTTTEFADRFETRFRLVQDVPKKNVLGLMTGEGGDTKLDLTATTILHKDATPPDARVEGILTNFKINLVGVIILHFDRLRFFKQTGRKPDVDVDLNPNDAVTFGGPLEFINTLKDYIPANGFSDPPDLQVTPAGITAGYSLGLPAIQCGILSLSNISLGAAFTLPFTGDAPTARFNFAERHNTFNLTVSLFGGGGFFAVVVGTSGVKEIEAALEFGAQVAINLGVASGSVYVKGGFYFHYALSPKRVEFEGYVELGGRLSVLGLISVSLTFHLSLAYEAQQLSDKPDGSPHSVSRLFGQASLVVEIEILFFSTSVSVKVEKTFAGSEADPLFIDFVPTQTVWDEYCAAFV